MAIVIQNYAIMISSNYFCCLVITLLTSSSDIRSSSVDGASSSAHLIVALPLQHGNESLSASWERGQEILSGAQLQNDILTQDKQFVTTKVDTRKCGDDNFNYLVQLINSTTTNKNVSLLGVVGMFCPFRVQLLLQLPVQNATVLELAIKPAYKWEWPESDQVSKMVNALLEFFTDLEWRKIGIITEVKPDITYFSQLAEELYKRSTQIPNTKITVYHYGKTLTDGNFNLPRIILISLTAKSATELLCNAYNSNLTWPKHVWVLHSYQLEDFELSKPNMSCALPLALENVLLFREDFQSMSGMSAQQNNVYSIWLHDAVWSTAAAIVERFQNKPLIQASSNVTHIPTRMQISIIHIRDSNTTMIARYSNELVFVDETFKTSAPSDELAEVYGGGSLAYTVSLATMICLGLIGTSVLLLGFIYFRQEPEIKSTSFSLSLLVFLGCYLTLIYLSLNLHLHYPGPNKALAVLCFSLHLLSGLGIPSALILATIAVKMLRIYHIFTKHSPKKLSRAWSDAFLLMYVMLILSPMILVYIIWVFVDPYTGFLQHVTDLDVIVVEKGCTSDYLTIWQAILVLYIVTLFLTLLVLAIMMRKIQHAHFKDTKKINILVLCLFLDLFLTLVIWRVLYTIVKIHIADILLHLGHHAFIILCQGFLFTPKILPPFFRRIKNSRKTVETETTDSHSTNKILIKASSR